MLLAIACFPPADAPVVYAPLDGPPPALTDVQWSCDAERGAWSFTLEADAWTGGGQIWMAEDDVRVEVHRIRSVEAAEDGTADRLEVDLESVADWRDAVNGSLTRWRCADEDALTFQALIFEVSGDPAADCRTWGAVPALWADISDAPDCDTLLNTSEEGR
ncbi:MAG: hypothetical protein AAFV53_05590 [Myxococcota bacterium]